MKFCGNCGNSVPDDARACPYCGSMLGGGPAPVAKKGGIGDLVQKYKKVLIGVCGAIAALLVVILLVNLFGSSYKSPFKQWKKLQNSKDYELEYRVLNSYDGLGKDQLKKIYKIASSSENFKDYEDDMDDYWRDVRDDREEDYGKNWKWSYEITDKDELDKDDLGDCKDSFKSTGERLMSVGDAILDLENDDLKDLAEAIIEGETSSLMSMSGEELLALLG